MNKIYLGSILVFLMCYFSVNAQELIYWDYLEHRENPSSIEHIFPYKNGIIYFLNSDGCFSSQTEIIYVDEAGEGKTIFESFYYASEVSFDIKPDSSIQIILNRLQDVKLFVPGIVIIEFDGLSANVQEINLTNQFTPAAKLSNDTLHICSILQSSALSENLFGGKELVQYRIDNRDNAFLHFDYYNRLFRHNGSDLSEFSELVRTEVNGQIIYEGEWKNVTSFVYFPIYFYSNEEFSFVGSGSDLTVYNQGFEEPIFTVPNPNPSINTSFYFYDTDDVIYLRRENARNSTIYKFDMESKQWIEVKSESNEKYQYRYWVTGLDYNIDITKLNQSATNYLRYTNQDTFPEFGQIDLDIIQAEYQLIESTSIKNTYIGSIEIKNNSSESISTLHASALELYENCDVLFEFSGSLEPNAEVLLIDTFDVITPTVIGDCRDSNAGTVNVSDNCIELVYFIVGANNKQVSHEPRQADFIVSNQNIEIQNISVFPNPVTTFISIQKENENREYKYEIFNRAGQLVVDGKSQDNKINTSLFESGIYFLKLIEKNKFYLGKFIKM